jgi:hypothetical protein
MRDDPLELELQEQRAQLGDSHTQLGGQLVDVFRLGSQCGHDRPSTLGDGWGSRQRELARDELQVF